MQTTLDLLTSHPFLADMRRDWVERLSYQARRAVHHGGTRLFREGQHADRFWLIREGRVALDFPVPGRGDIVIEQLGPGTVLGWAWLFPPYRWHFGAIAAEQTLTVELDGAGVRRLCDSDPAFGYDLTTRISGVLVGRLQAARIRLMDVYGYPAEAQGRNHPSNAIRADGACQSK